MHASLHLTLSPIFDLPFTLAFCVLLFSPFAAVNSNFIAAQARHPHIYIELKGYAASQEFYIEFSQPLVPCRHLMVTSS